MSTVIRIVESADGVAHTLQVPGYDTINPVTVPAVGTLDLLSTLSPETLHAMQPGLNLAVSLGELTVVGTITTAQLWALSSSGGGVTSVNSDSNPALTGAVQFVSGSHVTLSQTGNAITVNATGELAASLTSSHIFVGNGSNVATDTAMSGGATISNTGVVTLNASGASGLVQFSDGTTFASDSNIKWDSTNHRLILGGTQFGTSILSMSASQASLQVTLQNGDGAGNSGFLVENDASGYYYSGVYGSTAGSGTILQGNSFTQSNATNHVIFNNTGGIQLALGTATSNIALNLTSAGNIGIGSGVTPNASALIDMESTTQGFLPPQMTTAQMNAISSPANGLMVYVSDVTPGIYAYISGTWTAL